MGKINYSEVADFCKKNWQQHSQKVIEISDSVCENKFIFDMPWDMERTQHTEVFQEPINWYSMCRGDREFLFQFNRHGYFLHLLQAYYLTGQSKYAKKFCSLLEDWIDRVPLDDGNDTPWRSLEVGMRCETWTKAIEYIKDTPFYTDNIEKKFNRCLKQHIDVLIQKHSFFQKGSNWGIIQDSGLFCAGAYLKDDEAMSIAAERLLEQTQLQIMTDGMHWEQSSGYHNAVLFCLLNVIRVAREYKFKLPEELIERAYSMAAVNIKWIKPNRQHPLFGDSDANDIRDVMSRCAIIFESPKFKAFAYDVVDYDTAWIFGMDAIKKFDALESEYPKFLCTQLKDSGSYILRSGWDSAANWLCMHNGYTGGGHAHADKLHFDLMIGGRDVLVDSGRCTYMFNENRKFVKQPQGHNTCIVNDREFLSMQSQWDVINPALSIQYPMFDNERCSLIGGGHLGYLESECKYIQRQILYIKPDIFVILDSFLGSGSGKYNQFFHFSPEGKIKGEGGKIIFEDSEVKAELYFISEDIEIEQMESIYSSCYNTKCSNPALKTEFLGDGSRTAITVIYGACKNEFSVIDVEHVKAKIGNTDKILNYNEAEGVVIKTPEKNYTVCFAHNELKTPYVCADKICTGRIMVFDGDEVIFKKW